MPFSPGDPNINVHGRIPKKDGPSAKEIKHKEFMSLLRKLKPLQAKAITAASKILDAKDSKDSDKLRASIFITGTYKDLVKEVYDIDIQPDDDADPQEIDRQKGNGNILSLTVLNKPEKESDGD